MPCIIVYITQTHIVAAVPRLQKLSTRFDPVFPPPLGDEAGRTLAPRSAQFVYPVDPRPAAPPHPGAFTFRAVCTTFDSSGQAAAAHQPGILRRRAPPAQLPALCARGHNPQGRGTSTEGVQRGSRGGLEPAPRSGHRSRVRKRASGGGPKERVRRGSGGLSPAAVADGDLTTASPAPEPPLGPRPSRAAPKGGGLGGARAPLLAPQARAHAARLRRVRPPKGL